MPQHVMPRYRGFNLLDLFSTSNRWDEHFPMSHGAFSESDFQWISEWGFDFVRIPMSYLYFVEDKDRSRFRESQLEHLDQLVRWGEKYHIHVSLNFHRAAGYCINAYPFDFREAGNLWLEQESLDLFKAHWSILAERYKGISSDRLSFDLVNEPPTVVECRNSGLDPYMSLTWDDYVRVHGETADVIQAIDPGRLVVIEGANGGNTPCVQLAERKNLVQSCRGYAPAFLTHYQCPWVGSEPTPEPRWPWQSDTEQIDHPALASRMAFDKDWNQEQMREFYKSWFELADRGVPVHMGECGCYKYTPHKVMLQWFEALLSLMKEQNIGYALWNFRGTFGILDSERADIQYEDWYGHKLDRELLTLLQKY